MENKKRLSNFELMRIISMFYIVLFHIIINFKELLHDSNPKLLLVLNILLVLSNVHVNSFILLNGYFQYKKVPKKSKIISLINASWFYRIMSTIIVLYFGLTELSNLEIFNELFIVPMGHEHWFIHLYVVLYLISPYINKYIESIDKKMFKKTIIILIFLDSIIPFFSNNLFFSSGNGFSLIHFITIYFIGAFFGKYNIRKSYWFKKFNDNFYRSIHLFFYILFSFLIISINYFGDYLNSISYSGSILNEVGNTFNLSYDYCFIFSIIQSCAYFLFFSTINISYKKIINNIAKLTFGIYLIHELEIPKKIFYDYFKFNLTNMSSAHVIFRVLYLSMFIFIVCGLIEFLRQLLFKFINKRKITNRIKKRLINILKFY